jgi:hypothetical protein
VEHIDLCGGWKIWERNSSLRSERSQLTDFQIIKKLSPDDYNYIFYLFFLYIFFLVYFCIFLYIFSEFLPKYQLYRQRKEIIDKKIIIRTSLYQRKGLKKVKIEINPVELIEKTLAKKKTDEQISVLCHHR